MSLIDRLSLNQGTIMRTDLETALDACVEQGISSIGLWREPVAAVGLERAQKLITERDLRVSSLCRGGFFTVSDPNEYRRVLADNHAAIEETAELAAAGADGSRPVLVLVAGGVADRTIRAAREQACDAIASLVPHAREAGVTLAIEPMHPMYAADRGVVSTLAQALTLAEQFDARDVGVVIDAFHVWWDPQLQTDIRRAGAGARIASYQLGDWPVTVGPDPLLSRVLPGDGVVDLATMTTTVLEAGYRDDIEVEVFSEPLWEDDPHHAARQVKESVQRLEGLLASER